MRASDTLSAMYEELANHFARQGESRQRDQCLVLAADAAQYAGKPQEAERLRKRLLLANPHHLLRPYASMAEAMQSNDVRDYVLDLRKQWPVEVVAKILKPAASEAAAKTTKPGASAHSPDETVSAASRIFTLLVFSLGLACGVGILFVAIGWPFLR